MIDYKAILCMLIEDMGGEITITKSRIEEHHVLHYFDSDKEIVIVSETI
jgi:hypothetical protein